MKTSYRRALAIFNRWKFKGWIGCGIALLSFAAGSLITAHLTRVRDVRADSNRVFELLVYHTVPGKLPAVESIFRDVAKLQDKHDINVLGYWVPNEDPAWTNTFIYLVAYPNREDAKKNLAALHADPAFPALRDLTTPLIDKADKKYLVDEVYMRPTDYSAMK
jgi:NIPSNAP